MSVADANNDLASGRAVLQGRDGLGGPGQRLDFGLRCGQRARFQQCRKAFPLFGQ